MGSIPVVGYLHEFINSHHLRTDRSLLSCADGSAFLSANTSLVVERLLREQKTAGSNPIAGSFSQRQEQKRAHPGSKQIHDTFINRPT